MTNRDWPVVVANLAVGAEWRLALAITSDDGLALDPALWSGRAEFTRGWNGPVIADFATAGGTDGSLVLSELDDVYTRAAFVLPTSFTTTLAPSKNRAGAIQQAGVGKFQVWLTAAPAVKYRVCDFTVRIHPS